MDYNTSCRLCLSKGGRQCSIFGSIDDGLEPLNARILSCLSILVAEFDDLPKQICHRCECQVNVLHYFKVQCELSQRKLKRWQSTLPTPLQVPLECDIEESQRTDRIDIKVEREDIELHVEHHINYCEDSAGSQGYNVLAGDADSIDNDFTESEDENLQYPQILRQGDTSSSCNLVISATTSVAVEDGVRDESLACVDVDATPDKQISQLQNKIDSLPESKEGTDVLFKGHVGSRQSLLGGNQENTVADVTNALPANGVCSDFIHLGDSKNSLGSGGVPVLKDPLAASKDERMQYFEGILKVKEEVEDSEIVDDMQSPPFNHFDVRKNVSTNLLASTATQMEPSKSTGSDESSTRFFHLKTYHHIDLPKVNNHMLDEKSKYCKICQKSFANSNLWRHMKTCHAKENPFQCMACDKIFSGRRELVAHMIRTMSKDCRAGKKPERDMSLVTINKNVQYGVKGRYQCNECKEKFSKLNYTMAHVRLHTGERPFFCFKCNKDFRLKKTAANHVSSCSAKDCFHPALAADAVKPVSSSIKVSQILKRKAVKPLHSKDKLRRCTVCAKSFKSPVGFSNHLRGGCARKCFSCLNLVPQKSFIKHYRQCMKSQKFQSNKTFVSEKPTNDKLVDGEEDEDKHSEKDSKDVKKRKSGPITEIVDATVQELIAKHTDSQGKRLLTCQLCQRTMANKSTLYRHLIMHSSISVLKCELCNVRMSMPSVYKAHMAKFHGGSHSESAENSDTSQSASLQNNSETSKAKLKFACFNISKLKCDICMKLFSSATSLKFHKLTHRKVKCSKCEITFPASMEKSHVCNPKIKTEQLSLDQVHVAHPEASNLPLKKIPIQYTCHLCKKKFHTRKMLYQHKKMHIKVKIFKCQICENSYSDAGALQEHKLAVHAAEESLPSSATDQVRNNQQAGKIINSSSNDGLMSGRTEEKPWKCAVCCKGFINKKSYKRHLKLHGLTKINAIKNQKLQELVKCSTCDKAFSSYVSYTAHKGWHSRQQNNVESPVKAEKMETSESPRLALDVPSNVMTSPTSLQENFTCSQCPRAFLSLKSLRIHVTLNHKKNKQVRVHVKNNKVDLPVSDEVDQKPTLQCDTCPLTFADMSSLSVHINSHLENSLSFVTTPEEVPSEISKQEPLQCKLCNKEYRCKKSLKYHMMGHSGEKPYKCRSCSNQYSNPKALSKHEKERHTTVLRPFSCNRCKLSFILKEDLLAHHEKCSH